jgi:hypothetical protein
MAFASSLPLVHLRGLWKVLPFFLDFYLLIKYLTTHKKWRSFRNKYWNTKRNRYILDVSRNRRKRLAPTPKTRSLSQSFPWKGLRTKDWQKAAHWDFCDHEDYVGDTEDQTIVNHNNYPWSSTIALQPPWYGKSSTPTWALRLWPF